MTIDEILMIIAGGVLVAISFIIPERKEKQSAGDASYLQEQMQEMVSAEIKDAKGQVREIVDETISYSVEKAERAMERLTNEKILAVSEFSETVLNDINKNRDEVMFLYDMLNDKHENLKEAAEQISLTTKQANQANEALKESLHHQEEGQLEQENVEETKSFVPFGALNVEKIELPEEMKQEIQGNSKGRRKDNKRSSKKKTALPSNQASGMKGAKETHSKQKDITLDDNNANKLNKNEQILEMHRMNKSNVAIAKELGMGVGEVKLVIDLYSGM